jgi:Flp pilus assembly protein TadG
LLQEDGALLVEFALTIILCLTVIFGVMIFCAAFYSYNLVSEAAREATRYAIVRGATSCADATPGCNATTDSIQTYVRSLSFPGIDPSQLTATTVWSPTTAGATCAPSALCNNPGDQVQVTVQYQFPLDIPFVPPRVLTMVGTSQMVISQ